MANANEAVIQEPTIENLPDSPIAGKPEGQSYEQAGDSADTLEKLRAIVREELQSVKDVRIGKTETRLDKLESNYESTIAKYEALQAQGLTKDQALNKIQGDQELQDIKSKLDSVLSGNKPVPSTGVGEQDWAGKQASILDNAGIEKNDPRIVELLRTAESKQDFIVKLEAQTFAWKQADAKKPVPSSSTVAQTIPSVPTGDGTYTADKYKTDMLAAQGKPSELKRIKAQAKADGVPVDNIGFV